MLPVVSLSRKADQLITGPDPPGCQNNIFVIAMHSKARGKVISRYHPLSLYHALCKCKICPDPLNDSGAIIPGQPDCFEEFFGSLLIILEISDDGVPQLKTNRRLLFEVK